jgi:mycothiol synthase
VQLQVDGPLDGDFRWSIVVPENRTASAAPTALTRALAGLDLGPVQLWIREVDDQLDEVARSMGFTPYRDLWQLRCALPAAASGLATRAFTTDDLGDFVRVNNRAFRWHPEQGALTAEAVEAQMTESWFDPDGFRLHHDDDGALVGFCWTKVHAEHDPPLGEIYVIAIDPDHHGRGLGKPMTLAGLEWLTAAGLRHGMLYVESDNHAANATYEAIGFTRHHTDRAYRLEAQ